MISTKQINILRIYKSGLVKPFETTQSCASNLIGIQSQILSASYLALYNRIENLSLDKLNNNLYEDRNLVRIWGQRTTLHLYNLFDWSLIISARLNENSWWKKKVIKNFKPISTYTKILEEVEGLAKSKGLISRSSIKKVINNNQTLIDSWGGIFIDLVSDGKICHAQKRKESQFAHREYWCKDLEWLPIEKKLARQTLLKKYLANYGPATLKDFSYWSGLTLSITKKLYQETKDSFSEFEIRDTTYIVLDTDYHLLEHLLEHKKTITLLGRFDPLLLAHKDKSWLIDLKMYKDVWRAAGHIEGTILSNGKIVGTWRYKLKYNTIDYEISPFSKMENTVKTQIEVELSKLMKFFRKSSMSIKYKTYYS